MRVVEVFPPNAMKKIRGRVKEREGRSLFRYGFIEVYMMRLIICKAVPAYLDKRVFHLITNAIGFTREQAMNAAELCSTKCRNTVKKIYAINYKKMKNIAPACSL
jgi:hypothetical protein